MCSWVLTKRALALVVLAAPMLAGNATNYKYLALGDSIAFGYNPHLFFPFVSELSPPPTASQFTGYPEVTASPASKAVFFASTGGERDRWCSGGAAEEMVPWGMGRPRLVKA
jgi:hypothetical protein